MSNVNNPFAEMTDKLVEALVHVRVAKSSDPTVDPSSPTEREEFERIRQEHLTEARNAMECAITVVQRLLR